MKNAFLLTAVSAAVVYSLAITLNSPAVGSFVQNYLPMLIGGFAAAAFVGLTVDDCRRTAARQIAGRTATPVRPATKPTDPAYAGSTWGFSPASA